MITIFFSARARESKDKDFRKVAERIVKLSRADDGCLAYDVHQQKDDPRNFLLREQWRDQEALTAHVEHLVREFGPPPEGGQLPASILDLCESIDFKLYEPIE